MEWDRWCMEQLKRRALAHSTRYTSLTHTRPHACATRYGDWKRRHVYRIKMTKYHTTVTEMHCVLGPTTNGYWLFPPPLPLPPTTAVTTNGDKADWWYIPARHLKQRKAQQQCTARVFPQFCPRWWIEVLTNFLVSFLSNCLRFFTCANANTQTIKKHEKCEYFFLLLLFEFWCVGTRASSACARVHTMFGANIPTEKCTSSGSARSYWKYIFILLLLLLCTAVAAAVFVVGIYFTFYYSWVQIGEWHFILCRLLFYLSFSLSSGNQRQVWYGTTQNFFFLFFFDIYNQQ